ncbi:MAG: hypothetical protein AAGG51_02695 [Cyanobacteria bacterium P01_G01_bin.54]
MMSISNERDRYEQSVFPTSKRRLREPVFFNNAVYSLSHYGDDIYKFELTQEGKPRDLKKVSSALNVRQGRSIRATCVYQGEVYVFFDQDKHWKYEIRYKTNNDPEGKNWLPPEEQGASTGLIGGYKDWGIIRGIFGSIRATVFNDKIYLFYWRDDHFFYATYTKSNETWREVGRISPPRVSTPPKHYPFCAVATVFRANKPVICFAAYTHERRDYIQISYISEDNKIEYSVCTRILDWAMWDNQFSIGYGSIKSGQQANVIQIFCNNSGLKNELRRFELNVDSCQASDWIDTGIDNFRGKLWPWPESTSSFCDVVPVAVPTIDGKSFRHYLVVLTWADTRGRHPIRVHYLSSYASDLFECAYESETINMADEGETGTWSLVGVIEGVPPFTRNGRVGNNATSSVRYGQSSTRQIEVSQSFQTSVSLTTGVGIKLVDISTQIKDSFGTTTTMSHSFTKGFEHTFRNSGENQDGEYGWLIILRPSIRNRNYYRKSQDGSVVIGEFAVTWVTDVSISYRDYKLNAPYEGMIERQPSSVLRYWQNNQFPNYDKVSVHQVNTLTATTRGGSSNISLAIKDVISQKVEGALELKLSAKAVIKKLFNINSGAGFKFESKSNVTSVINESITARLEELPTPPPIEEDQVIERLEVTPAWFLPELDATLEPGRSRPHWIPDQFSQKKMIPWCLSWRVSYPSIDMQKREQ